MSTEQWKKKNREHLIKYLRNYFLRRYADPEWKEKKIEQNIEYYRRNKDKRRRYENSRYKNDPKFRERRKQEARERYKRRKERS